VLTRPDRAARAHADAVPYDVEMLPPVSDVLDDDALVIAMPVAELLLEALADFSDLVVREPLVLVRVDADVVQRLAAARGATDHPHIAERLIEVPGAGVTDLDEAHALVLALLLQVISGGAVAATNMALDNHARLPSASAVCKRRSDS